MLTGGAFALSLSKGRGDEENTNWAHATVTVIQPSLTVLPPAHTLLLPSALLPPLHSHTSLPVIPQVAICGSLTLLYSGLNGARYMYRNL